MNSFTIRERITSFLNALFIHGKKYASAMEQERESLDTGKILIHKATRCRNPKKRARLCEQAYSQFQRADVAANGPYRLY